MGDLALYLLSADIDPEALERDPASYDLPDSVLGEPPWGWPEPFRSRALGGREAPPSDASLSEEDTAALSGSGRC